MNRAVALSMTGLLWIAAPLAASLPVPPVPPVGSPAYDAAPVPDAGIRAPAEPEPSSIRVAPRLYSRETTRVYGDGYTRGSSFRENERERSSMAPGFNLRMTLP